MSSTLDFWKLRNSEIKKEFQTPHPSPSSSSQPTNHLSTRCWVPPKKLNICSDSQEIFRFYWARSFNVAFVPLHTAHLSSQNSTPCALSQDMGRHCYVPLHVGTHCGRICVWRPVVIINEPSTPQPHTPPKNRKKEQNIHDFSQLWYTLETHMKVNSPWWVGTNKQWF